MKMRTSVHAVCIATGVVALMIEGSSSAQTVSARVTETGVSTAWSSTSAPIVAHVKYGRGSITISGSTDVPNSGVTIQGEASITCVSDQKAVSGSVVVTNPIAVQKSALYKPQLNSFTLDLGGLIAECDTEPFRSAQISFHETVPLPNGKTLNGPNVSIIVDATEIMHDVSIHLRNIDDDGFVWISQPSDTKNAVCAAHFRNNHFGSADCSLTTTMRDRGIYSDSYFAVKFGNGGGFRSCGDVSIDIDGKNVWNGHAACAVRHTGWFYRATFDVNFVTGDLSNVNARTCPNIWDCPN